MAMVFLAGPLSGLVVQPLVGKYVCLVNGPEDLSSTSIF